MGDLGLIPGLGRSPGGGYGNPLHYSCLENPHGQRSLAGYSPWGHKESDTTEQISIAQCNIKRPEKDKSETKMVKEKDEFGRSGNSGTSQYLPFNFIFMF